MNTAICNYLLLVCCFGSFAFAKAQTTPTPQSAIQTFFKAFHARDTLQLRKHFNQQPVLHSFTVTNNKMTRSSSTIEEFLIGIAAIPSQTNFEERVLNYQVQVATFIATVSTPYEFYVNERLLHSGTNVFILVRRDGEWLIDSIADTRIKT
ncbi:MAG: nuclear transport factor 2 family protein [Nonlabens sp.]